MKKDINAAMIELLRPRIVAATTASACKGKGSSVR
jgi:hypothetical protein